MALSKQLPDDSGPIFGMKLRNQLSGRILVTGGTGFLARGLYRRAIRENWPAKFTAMARRDEGLARIDRQFPDVDTVRGDILDRRYLVDLFRGHDMVIHAAAVKHVDRSESQARTTIQVNVDGSRNVLYAAREARVGAVVLLSTDKAANPENTYGMTKALAERLFVESNRWIGDTLAYVVRYGNVVASTGSVIPRMLEAIASGRPVDITDPTMTRFFFPVDHAVDTILYALGQSPGSIVAPEMMSVSLARLVEAIGIVADRLPAVRHVGARPGEKVHEALITASEARRTRASGDGYYLIDPSDAVGLGAGVSPLTSDFADPIPLDLLADWIRDAQEIL